MRQALFSYKKADTPVHRMPATAKLAAQLALCIALFAKPHSMAAIAAIQAACGGIIAIAFAAARISLLELRRLKPILAIGLLYALFNVFSIAPGLQGDEGFRVFAKGEGGLILFSFIAVRADRVIDSMLYIYRFFMGALSALVFFETTSSLQIKAAFERIQEALARIFPPLRKANPALTIALAINFIPQVFSTWMRISRAAKAREPEGKRGSFFLGSLYARLLALFSCLISCAETTRRAIANRSAQETEKGQAG